MAKHLAIFQTANFDGQTFHIEKTIPTNQV